jgi:hypothetical protein
MTHPQLIGSMTDSGFYPHNPDKVELVQTHISYIFIAGDFVYKVKKPVNLGFLDFTSLEKRKYYCYEELRLNKRLAPEAYLEVVEIGEDIRGHLVYDSGQRIVEYAVKMRTLPQNKMLKYILAVEKTSPAIMSAIARKVAEFHAHAATGGKIDEIGGVETIRQNHEENFEQTENYTNITIPEYQYQFIKFYVRHFIDKYLSLFQKRVIDHKIRDCHGDLHLEHICVTDGIMIFDCIEFNERFRYEDVAAEIAFLAMDLDYNGYPHYADTFVTAYIEYARDPDIKSLLNFYKCYYAYVRGKVIGFRLKDKAIGEKDRKDAVKRASRYFDLAYSYAAHPENPTLILMAGLMGTGKSVLSQTIASLLDAEMLCMDVIRKEMLQIYPPERQHADFGKGIYANDISQKVYDKALEGALKILKEGKSAIIDASYKKREERVKAFEAAKKIHADFYVVECTCPEEIIKQRLDTRKSNPKEPSDGRWEIFKNQKDDFEHITEFSENHHLLVDTAIEPEKCIQQIIRQIRWTSLTT